MDGERSEEGEEEDEKGEKGGEKEVEGERWEGGLEGLGFHVQQLVRVKLVIAIPLP